MPNRRATRSRFAVLSLLLVPLFAVTVRADGPVAADLVPGGVTVSDPSGPGAQWGLAGGRNMQFTANFPANFSALTWGAVFGTTPTLAFDGVVDAAGETMTFSGGASNLPGGVARWTGSATVPLAVGPPSLTLQTRFTLTVTNGDGPVPLTFVANEVSPGVNMLTAGTFSANLLFEAFHNGSWQPAIALYNALPTPPGNPPDTTGPVMTGFSSGFYYTSASTFTLDQHHQAVMDKLNAIEGDTDWLRIDTTGRLQGVQVGLGQAQDSLGQVQMSVNQVSQQISNLQFPQLNDIATNSNLNQTRQEIQQMLLILFGLMPCPVDEQPELCAMGTFINQVAKQKLDVEVIEVSNPSSNHFRRWLLKTTKAGVPVDATLTRLLAIVTLSTNPGAVQDVTASAIVTRLAAGLFDVMVPVVPGVAIHAYQFDAHLTGTPPVVDAHGSALLKTLASNGR